MKIILIKNVKGLGEEGEIKDVSDGYARNYLFKNKLAKLATEKSILALQKKKEKEALKAEKDLLKTEKIVQKIEGMEITIKANINEKGKLYNSVIPKNIVKELKKKGFKIEEKQIIMTPIKEVGSYDISIIFKHGLEAMIRIIVE